MYQKIIEIDQTSYIEVSSRMVDGVEQVCLTFRTAAGNKTAAISALLDSEHAESVVNAINGAIASRRKLEADAK